MALGENSPLTSDQQQQQQMSPTSITSSFSGSCSETSSECVSPRTVIPSPKSKEVKSPENVDNAVVSSERSENPAENVSEKDQEASLSSDEIPPSDDDRPEKPKKSVTIDDSDKVTKEDDDDDQSSKVLAHLKPSPSVHVMESHHQQTTNSESSIVNPLMVEAWENLKKSVVMFNGIPVGTLAALDHSVEALNYNQVFVRDFVPSGLAYMMQSKPEVQIVKNFLLKTLHLQSWEKKVDNFTLAEGVMPASFKVLPDSPPGRDTLKADFGGSAIGRVAPVDSGFWWIIMLRSYTKASQDYTLAEMPEMQRGIRLILNLCLSDGFDTFPTLLCADGCSMIDRRMGVYGYPIEIQALFYFALRCAHQLLKPECGGKELLERIDKRIIALRYHIQTYFWLDHTQLNNIYRYKTEEYSHTAVNKFNVIPDSIPEWVFDFMPLRGGYFIGNVSPARMDFRWFLIGNCIAILSSLATPEQETAIMDLFEERWEDLIGEMPLKIAYPALEGSKWRIVTGCDPKNTSWSYHNGGSWPVLIWLFTAACIKSGRRQIAKRAIELAEKRLSKDGWPEYYDGKTGRFIGKQARKLQTWTMSGYIVAKQMIENPANVFLISLEEDKKAVKPRLSRSQSWS